MKKKLFATFGPLGVAVVILAVFFFSSYQFTQPSEAVVQDAASSMANNILSGDVIKNEAMKSKNYVPFFGSSELNRISPFHPSVLAKKYQRSYTPFLLGAPGTQSLSQYMMMQSMGDEMDHRRVVFVISPQWFVKNGVDKPAFDAHYSKLQVAQWLVSTGKIQVQDRYLARRLLYYDHPEKDQEMNRLLTKVAQGMRLSKSDRAVLAYKIRLFTREDELFSTLGMQSRQQQIDHASQQLPAIYDKQELSRLANRLGAQQTTNNKFLIQNSFYQNRIAKIVPKLKNAQKNWEYRYSPEFSDFQLVLQELAQKHSEALFIIPPVNEKWASYTGLSQSMLEGFTKKIKFQLQSQGFNQIADLSNQGNVDYFMNDTIHLGWQGWLACDQYIQPFLESKQQVHPSYQLDSAFYSKEWQQQSPDQLKVIPTHIT